MSSGRPASITVVHYRRPLPIAFMGKGHFSISDRFFLNDGTDVQFLRLIKKKILAVSKYFNFKLKKKEIFKAILCNNIVV